MPFKSNTKIYKLFGKCVKILARYFVSFIFYPRLLLLKFNFNSLILLGRCYKPYERWLKFSSFAAKSLNYKDKLKYSKWLGSYFKESVNDLKFYMLSPNSF